MTQRPSPIAVTMGEPGGIGPEIVVRALSSPVPDRNSPALVIGDPDVLAEALELISCPWPLRVVTDPADVKTGAINLLVPRGFKAPAGGFSRGGPSAEGGRAVDLCIRTGTELCLSGKASALVTAPIAKESLALAGLPWPGHTEFLADLTDTRDCGMMLVGGPLRVLLVTIHTSLRAAPDLITEASVARTVRLASRAGKLLGIEHPRIAVAGLNPHAGEGGMFGDEERTAITPAVERTRLEGLDVVGPLPPDTVFFHAYRGEYDFVVCMYHDQGLIPLKMIAFETGVNVTVGLPFVRTSPDHGTAFDIAWQGRANPSSMLEALRLATECASRYDPEPESTAGNKAG